MEERKKDHIELAFKSQAEIAGRDSRFFYEPMLASHPDGNNVEYEFLGKKIGAPIWISSMTGGTKMASVINRNLAAIASKYSLGMGLGSCRIILDDDKYFEDFNLRPILGDGLPFYANLGIAQVEKLIETKSEEKIDSLISKLNADGLIVHVNPVQEWLQPEGDRLNKPPIETLAALLENAGYKIIVKEVGQGMGPESVRAILDLSVDAFEFASWGGTNFAILELLRAEQSSADSFTCIANIGHDSNEMISFVNEYYNSNVNAQRKHIIVSGGIKNFLDGYYYINKLQVPSIYGQASAFLKYARENAQQLDVYVKNQIDGLKFAEKYLKVR